VARTVWGSLALVCAAACLVTGLFLAMNYAPTWEAAQPAVRTIQDEIGLGWLLRGLHHWGGTLAIVFVAIDLARRFLRAEHREARPWVRSVALLALLVAFAYTGYLLVGDERAAAGVVVLEGILRSAPLIGDALANAVLGGPVASSATLARLYALHAVLFPALLLWLAAGRRRDVASHALPACGVLVGLALIAWILPAAVGPAGSPAAPPAADARPEWFFLWVNELLHRFGGLVFLLGAVLPLGLLGALFALPWISSPATRKVELASGGLVLAALIALSVLAANREAPAETEEPGIEPVPTISPEVQEETAKTLQRFRCLRCHTVAGDEDGGEEGPPLPRGKAFAELYRRTYFRLKVADPKAFWADTGMTYPKNRKPTPEELALLERYFYDD